VGHVHVLLLHVLCGEAISTAFVSGRLFTGCVLLGVGEEMVTACWAYCQNICLGLVRKASNKQMEKL
jgi:hypothetical protein